MAALAVLSAGLTVSGSGHLDRETDRAVAYVYSRMAGGLDWLQSGIDRLARDEETAPEPGPTFLLVTSPGRVVGLDRHGLVTSRGSDWGFSDLPVLTGVPPSAVHRGERLTEPEAVLGLDIVRAFAQAGKILERLSEVNLVCMRFPRAYLSGGVVVELGSGDYRLKILRLQQVLAQLHSVGRRPVRIDLRFQGQVIVECDPEAAGLGKEV
jgi:hypothetical protein